MAGVPSAMPQVARCCCIASRVLLLPCLSRQQGASGAGVNATTVTSLHDCGGFSCTQLPLLRRVAHRSSSRLALPTILSRPASKHCPLLLTCCCRAGHEAQHLLPL